MQDVFLIHDARNDTYNARPESSLMASSLEQSLPPFSWVGWYPWSAFETPSGEVGRLLRRTGAYAIAPSEKRPREPPAPSAGCVVSIGETHREKRSLLIRLGEFGASAGFYGEPKNGHGAAWAWSEKWRAPARDQSIGGSRSVPRLPA